jgi:hypothetical protein
MDLMLKIQSCDLPEESLGSSEHAEPLLDGLCEHAHGILWGLLNIALPIPF